MVFSCSRFADSGMLDLVVALAVVGFILVFGIVSRWLFPCPVCKNTSGETYAEISLPNDGTSGSDDPRAPLPSGARNS